MGDMLRTYLPLCFSVPHSINLFSNTNQNYQCREKLEQFLKILVAQHYSQLYNCAPLWLNSDTRWNLKRLINSAHYKALRITAKDYKNKLSRDHLDNQYKRATPQQWGSYASTRA